MAFYDLEQYGPAHTAYSSRDGLEVRRVDATATLAELRAFLVEVRDHWPVKVGKRDARHFIEFPAECWIQDEF